MKKIYQMKEMVKTILEKVMMSRTKMWNTFKLISTFPCLYANPSFVLPFRISTIFPTPPRAESSLLQLNLFVSEFIVMLFAFSVFDALFVSISRKEK